MRGIKQNDRIELLLPANRELMLVVRLATSGVVARAGLTIDALDDVKMAVEEACMYMMSQASAPEQLKISFGLGEKMIDVEIIGVSDVDCGDCGSVGGDSAELEVVRCILESLVDSVDISADGNAVGSICLKAGTAR